MKRIEIIDSLRGIAILVMLLFHSSYYWQSDLSVDQYNQMLQTPGGMIALVLGKFAGIFAIISGMGYTYSALRKKEIQNTPTRKIVKSITISGFWVVFISKIHAIFFNHSHLGDPIHPYPTGPTYHTLITGSITTGTMQLPGMYLVFYRSTALLMIGISVIWTGIVLAILFANNGHTRKLKNVILTCLIGTAIILATEPMINYFRPMWVEAILHGDTLQAIVLGLFVGDPFPFFPFAGYATYGILFGMAFYYEVQTRMVIIIGSITGSCYFGGGIYLYVVRGYTKITNIFEPPEMELNFIQVGMMIYFCTIIYIIHNLDPQNWLRTLFISPFFRRFGLMTLTIFMFEPLLGTIIKVYLIDILFPHWSSNIIFVVLYSLVLIGLWYKLLVIWQHHQFKGSWEWINAKTFQLLSRNPTMQFNLIDNLEVTD